MVHFIRIAQLPTVDPFVAAIVIYSTVRDSRRLACNSRRALRVRECTVGTVETEQEQRTAAAAEKKQRETLQQNIPTATNHHRFSILK